MSAAEELTAAADKLDALASGATDGPWRDMPMGSEGSTVLAGGNTVSTARRVARASEFPDAAYIAAMNPLVGEALAEWLRSEATAARGGEGRGFGGADLYRVNPRALALVRLINGTQSAES